MHARTSFLHATGALVAASASCAVVSWCAWLGFAFAREIHPWCGTGADRVYGAITSQIPPLLIVPVLGWLIARGETSAARVARGSALAAASSYLTVVLLMQYA